MISLSIVVPCFNEEARLPATLERILSYAAGAEFKDVEVLVVDDGSSDGTAALAANLARSHPSLHLLSNPGNRGKGYAVRHGMLAARGEWILFTDADLSAPIEELAVLLEAAGREKAEIAIGSRALDRSKVGVRQGFAREYLGRAFNLLMRLFTGLPFRDTQCGFKLFSARAARAIFARQQLDGFGFDVEDLFIARRLGLPAVEAPVRWNNVAGTRVTVWDGMRAFADLARIRWFDWRGRYL